MAIQRPALFCHFPHWLYFSVLFSLLVGALDKFSLTVFILAFFIAQNLHLNDDTFTHSCVQHWVQGTFLHKRVKTHSQTLIYTLCVQGRAKQQRVDDNVPPQTLCNIHGLLNAVTGSCCGWALHLTSSLSLPLHPSLQPSLSLPPDSNDAGKIVERSQHPTSATRERARRVVREDAQRKSTYREERDCECWE